MQLPRRVLKFGGTSVGDARTLVTALGIVDERRAGGVAVVVSAAAGITDALVALVESARQDRPDTERRLAAIDERHALLVAELALPTDLLKAPLAELHELVHGIRAVHECTPRTWDRVVSTGEVLMASIFAAALAGRGIPARAWEAGRLGLVTDDRFGRARPLPEAYAKIASTLTEAPEGLPVITGFLGVTLAGERTTLGRGGSDYSAAIVARAIGAAELEIWTDVDGILTADPRLIPGAYLIDRLSFAEASELAYSGARVLHPSTITPAMEGNIPVRVLNTRNPTGRGTLIQGLIEERPETAVRSIAHKPGVQVVTVVSPGMLDRPGFLARIATVFDRHRISVDMISTSEVSVSFTADAAPSDLAGAMQELADFSDVSLAEGRGKVSIVGAGLGEDSAAVGELLGTVAATGAQVEMISYGATRLNLSLLVRGPDLDEAVRALHRHCFER